MSDIPLPKCLAYAAALAASMILAQPAEAVSQTRLGDVLELAIPVATFGAEWWRGEREGAWEYGESLAAAVAATEVLKRATRVERPDHHDKLSFPSGHATAAYSAASYVNMRYGWEPALPLYALGTYVGYTRVRAHEHRWTDVAGSLAVTTAASLWLVHPKDRQSVSLSADVGARHVALMMNVAW